jgi:hypothetical protein
MAGEAAQFRLDKRRQSVERGLIAVAPGDQEFGQFVRLECTHLWDFP